MKSKLLSLFVVLYIFPNALSAIEIVEDNPSPHTPIRYFTKWFTSINGGTQFYIGDHDKQINLVKRLTPHYEFSIGKWLNQSFGVRASVNGFKIKGLTKKSPYATSGDMIIKSPHYLYNQEFNFVHIHTDLLFHFSNDAYDIDLDRLYNIIPYGGLGIISATNQHKKTNIILNLGLIQSLRLNSNVDLNFDMRGSIVSDSFDGEIGGKKFEGSGAATIGITYTFR